MRHSEGSFTTHDGLTIYRQTWHADGEPRAVIMLLHGLGEHSGRYVHLAHALTDAGYTVEALDHRGHGKSQGKRAYVKRYDELMADTEQFRELVDAEHPDSPLVVFGHSMGGNLAVGHVLDHQDGVQALALSAPLVEVGDDFSPIKLKVFAQIAKFAPGFRPQALSADAISRDPAVVAAYRDDPLVYNGKISAGMGAALIGALQGFPARYPELRLPILLQHGTADRLVAVSGSHHLESGAINAAVTSHYYDGLFHEIYNEPEQATVIADLITWLDSVVA